MSGHCEQCREFSFDLRDVEAQESVCLPAGQIIPAWYRLLCPVCVANHINSKTGVLR
jgi:hypothetical protein